ncbi:MAG: bifunctional folylpolyglutamate synthase/dihydrofolate synthase, partial [Endomicrobium sp.]|jgi:dihydrofolate synthase/folylpolyglutamate synthase|nr:bifunctional folylpolyglutamate synthase/dihydrofolate synthase [Endomicrobium sp.]
MRLRGKSFIMDFFDSLKEYEGMKPGLSRIKKFLKDAGDPQDKIKCIHIAGTNGKGSAAAFLAAALEENGYKTALYTSPHLIDITERIQINGKNISKTDFTALSKKYIHLAKKYKLSYFEYLTALAFVYFAVQKVGAAVIETGLGGRFDATNIIKKPLACVITSIGLDHKEILGNSVSKIAFEKAGIIKKNCPVICGDLPKSALKAVEKKAKPLVLGKDFRVKKIKLSLLGKHQQKNAAVAFETLKILRKHGFKLDDNKIKSAFKNAKWPARLDIRKLPNKAKLLIDGAHNEQAVKAFVSFLKSYLKGKKAVFIFAAMKEKEYKKVLTQILPFAKKIFLPNISSKRAEKPEILEKEILKISKKIKTVKNICVKEVLKHLARDEKNISVGSLYLAGEILKTI